MTSKQKQFEITIVALHASSYSTQDEHQLAEAISFACKSDKNSSILAIEESKKIMDEAIMIDEEIAKYSNCYSINRISNIEKAILRGGIYYFKTIGLSKSIIISECIRLVKKFGNPRAINFIHAVLDSAL